MAVKSYGFAVGSIRSKEKKLLSSSDYIQLSSAKSLSALEDILKSKGIGEQTEGGCLEMIKSYSLQLWSYINEIIPDEKILYPILWENDFHNLKAVMKCVLKDIDYKDYILEPFTVRPILIEKALADKNFNILPDFLKTAALEGFRELNQTHDAQLSDGIVDKYSVSERLKLAYEMKLPFIIKITEISSFYSIVKAALRISKTGKSREFSNAVLTDIPYISKKDMQNALLSGEEKVIEIVSKVSQMQADKACELYKSEPWKMEKFADEMVVSAAKECKSVNFGAEPILSYLVLRRNEEKNLRIIYSSVKTNLSSEIMSERLRDING